MIDNQLFGRRLAEYRNEKGLSQQGLAVIMNVTHQAVSKWENGVALPDMQTMLDLAQFFNVSMETLLTGAPEKQPAEFCEKTAQEETPEAPWQEEVPVEPDATDEPKQPESTQSTESPDFDWHILVGNAPLMGRNRLEQAIGEHMDTLSGEILVSLAPFLSGAFIGKAVETSWARIDQKQLISLAPFMKGADLNRITQEHWDELDKKTLMSLSPFMSGVNFKFSSMPQLEQPVKDTFESAMKTLKDAMGGLKESMTTGRFKGQNATVIMDNDAKPRKDLMRQIAEKAVEENNTDWLEEYICELDTDVQEALMEKAIKLHNRDIMEIMMEEMDKKAKHHFLVNAAENGEWDFVEEYAEDASHDTLQELIRIAMKDSNWEMINTLSEML